MNDSSSQDINYFSYQKITDGVYAAIANEQQGTFGNCGIIDMGDQTLILDTSESIFSATELRETAERLTGRPASILVISHAHPDHTFGMKAFSDVPIIASTPIIRQEILGLQEYAASMRMEMPDWKTFLAEQQADLESETDKRRSEHLIKSIKRTEQSIQNIPHLELRLPNMTFDQQLILHGQDRTVELITNGKGHTVSDCYILLPDENVLFYGDLAFFQRQPFMADCDPKAWISQLKAMECSAVEVIVPGHGPVGAKEDMATEREYIAMLEHFISEGIDKGLEIEDIIQRQLPEPFDAWSIDGTPSEPNVRFYYNKLTIQEEEYPI